MARRMPCASRTDTSATFCSARTNEEMVTDIFRHLFALPTRICPSISMTSSGSSATRSARVSARCDSREFLMKDAYSFDLDRESARHAYNRMSVAYLRTFAGWASRPEIPCRLIRSDRRGSEPRIHLSCLDRRGAEVLLRQGLSRFRHIGGGMTDFRGSGRGYSAWAEDRPDAGDEHLRWPRRREKA